MTRTFHILTKIEASEETWANIDATVARIMECDKKGQIEDICLSTLDTTDNTLNPLYTIFVVGKIDYDVQDMIEAVNHPAEQFISIELVCPSSATLSVYPK